ncbi:MAG: nucleoside hydrolase, partial [Bacteroidota bacterium]
MKTHIFVLLLLISVSSMNAQVKVILDTDPSADPDDVGCMAMLHNMATNGECEILAMINSTHYKQSAMSISAINMYYNRSAIPVGDYKGSKEKLPSTPNNYDSHLAQVYPRTLSSWKAAEDGVQLYREILAS